MEDTFIDLQVIDVLIQKLGQPRDSHDILNRFNLYFNNTFVKSTLTVLLSFTVCCRSSALEGFPAME